MAEPHVQQRRLLTRDNPDVLRGMNSESAELLCLDPPCNTNRHYEAAHRLRGGRSGLAGHVDSERGGLDMAWLDR